MSPNIDNVTGKSSIGDVPTSNTAPTVFSWKGGSPFPNHLLKAEAREKDDGHSEISGRTATTFQNVDDMGHQDWINSLDFPLGEPPNPVSVELSSAWEELSNACVPSAMGHTLYREFLPLGQLLAILSAKNVDKLLRQEFPNGQEEFHHQVYDAKGLPKRLKIMGTLLLMEKLVFLRDFIKANVDDSQIPLGLKRIGGRPILYDRDGKRIQSVHTWSWAYHEAEFFTMKQMQLCSLFCTVKKEDQNGGFVNHFQLLDGAILPFRACEVPETMHGGFGTVTKVKIEPSHLSYEGGVEKPEYFSVKTIWHDLPEHPDEADSLAKWPVIRERADREHLHRLLFSFRRADRYYLVFEWADGDLTKLWQKMPGLYEPTDYEHVRWFLGQCVGIMRSLKSLQNLHELKLININECHGRHSDIKPQNILWFKNYQGQKKNHLVIADLGLTQFNTTQSKSRMVWADVRGYTHTYKAPESDVERLVGGKYDIWCIGCVFLEHASVFLRCDAKCVEDFSDRRKEEDDGHKSHPHDTGDAFYNLVKDGGASTTKKKVIFRAEVKNAVKKWIKDLQALKSCSATMSRFLDLIDKGMLVPDTSQRKNSGEILDELIDIQEECERNNTFACSPKDAKPVQDLEIAVAKQDRYEVDTAARQSQQLAGITGAQEDPDAKLPSGEIDLELAGEPGPSFSSFRCMDTPPASLFSETPRTQSSASSVSSLQQTSSINKLIQSFELLTISKRRRR